MKSSDHKVPSEIMLNITTDKDFLFVIALQDETYCGDQESLSPILKELPPLIRIYGIINSGMNNVRIYCVTNNYTDYESVSETTGLKTAIVNTKTT